MFTFRENLTSKYNSSTWDQFSWCLWRKVQILKRDPSQGVGQISMMVIMGALNSLAYQGLGDKKIEDTTPADVFTLSNNLALLMQIGMLPVLLGLANLPVYAEEKLVAMQESNQGMYSPAAFLVASSVAPLPIAMVAIFSGVMTAWGIGLNFQSEYVGFGEIMVIYVASLLGFLAIDSLFQLFAYLFPDAEQAQGPAIMCYMFFNMFNGFLPSPSIYPKWVEWGIWVSPTYYQMAIAADVAFIDGGNNATKALALNSGLKDRGIEMWLLYAAWILVFRTMAAITLGRLKPAK